MTDQVSRGASWCGTRWWLVAALAAFLAGNRPALSQVLLKVNDDVYFRFGVLLQAWADWQQDAATGGFGQNLFLRRARIMIGGQVAPDVSFLLVTDSPNLGRAPKSLGSGFVLVDAMGEWKLCDEFRLVAGLMLLPLCRNCQQGAGTLLSLDYGTYTFLWTVPTQSPYGRDAGFMAKGYLANQRLEYRIGAYQGAREAGSRNAFRATGRIQYNFLDTEVVVFYPGTYLGTKKVLAIGGGYDVQQDYHALAADIFFDYPVAKAGGVTAQADFIHYDGGSTFPTLPPQNDWFAEAGFYVARLKLLPFVRFESQDYVHAADAALGQKRYQAGVTWFVQQSNFNIRGAWTKVTRQSGPATDDFTLQLQFFYF
jgi:hypothetical protein